MNTIKREMSDSDCCLYLLLLGSRYGSLVLREDIPAELGYPPRTIVSYSELEFDLAAHVGIPRLVYIKDPARKPKPPPDPAGANGCRLP